MQRRRWISFGVAAVAICLAGGTAFAALTSATYRMANNTFEGGEAGAGVSSASAGYTLTGMTFGHTNSALSSTTFQMCTGFACADPIYGLNLTSLQK